MGYYLIIGLLLLPFAVIYGLTCIKKPFWIVAFLGAYLPFEELVLKWAPTSLYTPLRFLGEATILLLLCVYLIDRVILKQKWIKTPIDLPIVILVAAILLSTVVNNVPILVALLGVKNLLRYVALFYLIILIRPSEEQINLLIKFLFLAAIIQAGIAILQSLIGKPAYDLLSARDVIIDGQIIRPGEVAKLTYGSYRTMVFGTMVRYNFLGNYLAIWLGIAGATLMFKYPKLNIKIWHIMLLSIALLLTYSRMSWIAIMMAGLVLFAFSRKNRIFVYIISSLIFVFTFLASMLVDGNVDVSTVDVGLGNPLTRYLNLFSTQYLEVLVKGGRAYSYLSIVPAVLRISPVVGLGPGMIASDVSNLIAVSDIAEQLKLDNPNALRYLGDAGFATIIAQLGLLGFIAIVLVLIQLFRTSFQTLKYLDHRTLTVGYIMILVMMIIFNLASFAFIYRVPGYYFWMFSAFIVLQAKRNVRKTTYILNVKSGEPEH